jgi:hypothetical protein
MKYAEMTRTTARLSMPIASFLTGHRLVGRQDNTPIHSEIPTADSRGTKTADSCDVATVNRNPRAPSGPCAGCDSTAVWNPSSFFSNFLQGYAVR